MTRPSSPCINSIFAVDAAPPTGQGGQRQAGRHTRWGIHRMIDLSVTDQQPKLNSDDDQAEQLGMFVDMAQLLNRGGQFAYFWTDCPEKYLDKNGDQKELQPSFWYRTDRKTLPPAAWRDRQNCYFGVAVATERGSKGQRTSSARATAVNAIFADIDGKDCVAEAEWLPLYQTPDLDGLTAARARGALTRAQNEAIGAAYKADPAEYKRRAYQALTDAPLPASAAWDTGGGYHAVWLLQAPIILDDATRPLARHLEREWVALLGADPAATDFARVLRVPGTFNRKPKYAPDFPMVRFLWCNLDLQYTPEDFTAYIPPLTAPTKRAARAVHVPAGVPLDLATFGDVPKLPPHPAIARYNAETNIHDLLLQIGYTDARPGRMHRPGGSSGGIELNDDNSAKVYSSADPLFCNHRVRPAHVLAVYEHAGDVDALLTALTGNAYEPIDQAKAKVSIVAEWLRTADFAGKWAAAGTEDEQREAKRYRAADTDIRVAMTILKTMEAAGRTVDVRVDYRDLMTGAGVGLATVARAIARLRWLFDVARHTDGAGYRYALCGGVVAEVEQVFAVSETRCSTLATWPDLPLVTHAGSDMFARSLSNLTAAEVERRNADRADRAAAAAATISMLQDRPPDALTDEDHALLRRAYVDRKLQPMRNTPELRRRMRAAVGSVGPGALRIVDLLATAADGTATRAELGEALHKGRPSISRLVKRLGALGIVSPSGQHDVELAEDWRDQVAHLEPLSACAGGNVKRRRLALEGQIERLAYLETQTQDVGRLKWLRNKQAALRLELLKLQAPELAAMKDAQMAARGIDLNEWRKQVLPAAMATTTPKTYAQQIAEREADARRLTRIKKLAADADRATVRSLSAADQWRDAMYADSRDEMIAAMPDFRTWAADYYGPEWVLKSRTDLLGAFKVYQLSGADIPLPDVVAPAFFAPIPMGDYSL